MAIFNIFQALVGVAIVYIVKVGFNRFKEDTFRRTAVNKDSEEEWSNIFKQFSIVEFWLNCMFYLVAFVGGLFAISASLYWLFPIGFIVAVHQSAISFAVALLLILLVRAIYRKVWEKSPKVARFDAEVFTIFLKERDYAKPRKYMVRTAYVLIFYSFTALIFTIGKLVITLLSGGA